MDAYERTESGRALLLRLTAWVVGFLLALWLALQWGVNTGVHNDFTQNVWLPSRLVLDGANPYNPSPAEVNAALGNYSSAFEKFNSGTNYHAIYPLWLSLVFAPFAMLPLALSLAIWRAANLLLLVWGVMRLLRVCNPAFRPSRFAAAAAVATTLLLAIIYRESIVTLFAGQFSIIEFGILVGIWSYLISSHEKDGELRLAGDILMGVGLAVLATKPQVVGLPVLLLGLWALTRRRWAIAASAIVSLFLLLVAPLLFYPESLSDWLHVVVGGQASSQVQVSASVWGISYQWLHGSMPWVAVAVALSLVGLVALVPVWRRDLTNRTSPVPLALPLTICINSVISPYMLGYEQVLLLLPAMIFLAAAGLPGEQNDYRSSRWRLVVYLWLAVLPLLIVVIQTFVDLEYPVAIQSFTMLALCWIANCGVSIAANVPQSRFFLSGLRSSLQINSGNQQSEGGTVGITS